jgi:phosphatidylinositol alpha-mannosyltransferase
MIGVLMSATLPARLGEPSRALIMARRVGRVRDRFPIVLGTLVSQTLLNILALIVLGAVMFQTVGLFKGNEQALIVATIAPVVLPRAGAVAPVAPATRQAVPVPARPAGRHSRPRRDAARALRPPGVPQAQLGAWALVMQLSAWAIQWLACYVLLVALGLDDHAGIGAAAAVLFAGQRHGRAAGHPVEPGRVPGGLRCCPVAYGVGKTNALAYGIILRRWRSAPPWRWACRRLCARA